MQKGKIKKRNLNEKENSGITLIALVITIVVLLILASTAVTIGLNNGEIFGHANNAKEKWNESVAIEEAGLKDYLITLDNVSPTLVTVSENFPAGWNDNHQLSKVATAGGRTVPIPAGFVLSEIDGENTIPGGLVIYQTGDTPITENFWTELDTENPNLLKCKTTYNQYIWIPVDDINSMIMCKSNNNDAVQEGTITIKGVEQEEKTKVCHIELVNGVLQCTNSEHTATATALCGRLYDNTTNSNTETVYTITPNFDLRNQTYDADSGLREPAYLSNYSDDATKAPNLESEFLNMAKSVYTYGGFYISRYEIGGTISNPTSVINQGVISNSSDTNNWYGMHDGLLKTIGGTTSQMIWGCQYDQVVKFLGNQANTGHSTWTMAKNKTEAAKSGTHPDDKMNNIYDLEGNFYEWTAEAYNAIGRVFRGSGHYDAIHGVYIPASRRFYQYYPSLTNKRNSTRSALYVTL